MSQRDVRPADILNPPLVRRVIIAAPGALGAALLIVCGLYFVVTGLVDAGSLGADDEFASIPTSIALVGVVGCLVGLLLASATAVVALAKPHRVLLTVAALVTGCGAVLGLYLLATGADGLVYVPLTAVLGYLSVVAVLRLVSRPVRSSA